MFQRKLVALGYFNVDTFNINDDKSFKELIIWLEDQKIRHYKIDDRKEIKNINSLDWQKSYKKYLGDINCPINPNEKVATIDWLLGLAVRLEYSDNIEKYKEEDAKTVLERQNNAPKVVYTNPLDSLDFSSTDFKEGVDKVAKMLKMNSHPDPDITLKGISRLVCTRFTPEALQNPGEIVHQGMAYPIFESDLGFETGDYMLNKAGKVLRLMYIHDLRELQTKINECIVSVQTITANPKTDTKLGKVGR